MIFQALPSFWQIDKVHDLAIAVLTACPELVKPTFQVYEEALHLKIEETKSWIDYIGFVKKVNCVYVCMKGERERDIGIHEV